MAAALGQFAALKYIRTTYTCNSNSHIRRLLLVEARSRRSKQASYTDKERLKRLLASTTNVSDYVTEYGETIFHVAVSNDNLLFIELVLEAMLTESGKLSSQNIQLLTAKDCQNGEETIKWNSACYQLSKEYVESKSPKARPFFIPATGSSFDCGVLTTIKDSVDNESWVDLMEATNAENLTCLHIAVAGLQIDVIGIILSRLHPTDRMKLLLKLDNNKETPLEKVLTPSETEFSCEIAGAIVESVLHLVREENRLKLAQGLLNSIYSWKRFIKQQSIREYHSLIALRVIQSFSCAEYQKKLIGQCIQMEGTLQDAALGGIQRSNSYTDFLERLDASATLSILNSMEDQKDRQKMLDNIIENYPLTVEQLDTLSQRHNPTRYLIPRNQTNSSPRAIILYNNTEREGAAEEAENLANALHYAGFKVTIAVWSHTCELQSLLDKIWESIETRCCLLKVCIMCHGSRGRLRGSDGSRLLMNDVSDQLTEILPRDLPLILLIQACQSEHRQPRGDTSVDAGNCHPTADLASNEHIRLTRPHTVLLLATVVGGFAYRGFFTGAIADELSKVDGERDIYKIFSESVKLLGQSDRSQTPELRSTLKKDLVLRPRSGLL